jgi:hypothetical protein
MIYYVALPFTPEEGGGLAPGQPVECPSGAAAMTSPQPGHLMLSKTVSVFGMVLGLPWVCEYPIAFN